MERPTKSDNISCWGQGSNSAPDGFFYGLKNIQDSNLMEKTKEPCSVLLVV